MPAQVENLHDSKPSGTMHSTSHAFDDIPSTIEAFRNGEFIIVLDDTSRENEGDLIIAADAISPAKMSFMVRYSSGLICTPLTNELADKFELPLMVPPKDNEDPNRTAYTVSIDPAEGATTGISAQDRARSCNLLADSKTTAASFRRPGHVFPLRARNGGIRERQGHTEAAVEFCRLAGRPQVGVICEIVDDGKVVEGKAEFEDGGMLRRDGCLALGRQFGLKVCTIEDLVEYVEKTEGKLGSTKTNGANGAH